MQDKRATLHLRAGDLRGVKLQPAIALEYSDYTPLILPFAEQWAVPVPRRIRLTTLTNKALGAVSSLQTHKATDRMC